jgi:hypothetical protein
MPRSLVRPNVSTYHETIHTIIAATKIIPVPAQTKGGNFTAKSLAYLAGLLNLPITAKVQDICNEFMARYNLPSELLTWMRVYQQHENGVVVPAKYGNYAENSTKIYQVIMPLIPQDQATDTEDQTEDPATDTEDPAINVEEYIDDQIEAQIKADWEAEQDARRQRYDELAAANPLAAQFAKMIIAQVDAGGDDDTDEDLGENGYDYDDTDHHDFEE